MIRLDRPLRLVLSVSLLLAACSVLAPEATEAPTVAPLEPTVLQATAEPTEQRYLLPGDYLDSLVVANQRRDFVLHVPTGYQPGAPLPLVFDLHGAGGNALQQEALSHWHDKADQEGFFVATPQALGNPPAWTGVFLDEQGNADMLFLFGLLEYLKAQLNVDPGRIYATGLSNGGTMVNRLGCDLSEQFAAIAPVSGAHSGMQLCQPKLPVSVIAIHGTDDRVIPYEGNGSDVPSVHTWVSAWAERDGCDQQSAITRPYDEASQETWSNCQEGTQVVLLTIEGGGHGWLGMGYEWNGTTFVPSASATDVIWTFFAAHARGDGS